MNSFCHWNGIECVQRGISSDAFFFCVSSRMFSDSWNWHLFNCQSRQLHDVVETKINEHKKKTVNSWPVSIFMRIEIEKSIEAYRSTASSSPNRTENHIFAENRTIFIQRSSHFTVCPSKYLFILFFHIQIVAASRCACFCMHSVLFAWALHRIDTGAKISIGTSFTVHSLPISLQSHTGTPSATVWWPHCYVCPNE